jgi:hypothetical protein
VNKGDHDETFAQAPEAVKPSLLSKASLLGDFVRQWLTFLGEMQPTVSLHKIDPAV